MSSTTSKPTPGTITDSCWPSATASPGPRRVLPRTLERPGGGRRSKTQLQADEGAREIEFDIRLGSPRLLDLPGAPPAKNGEPIHDLDGRARFQCDHSAHAGDVVEQNGASGTRPAIKRELPDGTPAHLEAEDEAKGEVGLARRHAVGADLEVQRRGRTSGHSFQADHLADPEAAPGAGGRSEDVVIGLVLRGADEVPVVELQAVRAHPLLRRPSALAEIQLGQKAALDALRRLGD